MTDLVTPKLTASESLSIEAGNAVSNGKIRIPIFHQIHPPARKCVPDLPSYHKKTEDSQNIQ